MLNWPRLKLCTLFASDVSFKTTLVNGASDSLQTPFSWRITSGTATHSELRPVFAGSVMTTTPEDSSTDSMYAFADLESLSMISSLGASLAPDSSGNRLCKLSTLLSASPTTSSTATTSAASEVGSGASSTTITVSELGTMSASTVPATSTATPM